MYLISRMEQNLTPMILKPLIKLPFAVLSAPPPIGSGYVFTPTPDQTPATNSDALWYAGAAAAGAGAIALGAGLGAAGLAGAFLPAGAGVLPAGTGLLPAGAGLLPVMTGLAGTGRKVRCEFKLP